MPREIRFDPAAGMARIANEMADECRRNVPQDSGGLRDSIAVRYDGDGIEVVAAAPHAFYVEYGTEDTPASAFMRRAAHRVARRMLRQEVRRALVRT